MTPPSVPTEILMVGVDGPIGGRLERLLTRALDSVHVTHLAAADLTADPTLLDAADLCFVAEADLAPARLAEGAHRPDATPIVAIVADAEAPSAALLLEAGAFDVVDARAIDRRTIERIVRHARDRATLRGELAATRERLGSTEAAVERLRASEQLFESFMQNSPALNFIKDSAGTYLYVNRSLTHMLELDPAEVTGRRDFEVHAGERAASFRRYDRQAIESDSALEFTETFLVRGREVIVHVIKFPIHTADGRTLIAGNAVDITARVRAEESARTSEERFLLSARATNDLVYDWDLESDSIWWNENIAIRFGYSPATESFNLEWWKRAIHPDDSASVVRSLEAAIASGAQTWAAEYRFRHSDGRYATVLDRGYLLYRSDGEPARMIGAMIDLTERVLAEEELRRREEEYRRIVETSQEGIWVTDRRGVTTFVNATMARMLGATVEGMLGTKFENYLDEESRAAARSNKERRARGIAEKYDLRLLRGDGGPIWTIVSANPIFDRDGGLVGSLAMVTDITDRKRAEQALREANDRLEQRVYERTAELDTTMRRLEQASNAQKRFVADASHDLRTPLTVIRAELDLLLELGGHDERTRGSLQRAVREARRLDALATDLLTLATLDQQDLQQARERARLDEILLESISNLTSLAREKRIAWTVVIDDAVEIACNRAALQRAFGNVLDNAIKYSPEGSSIAVALSRRDDAATIVVDDSGIGIAEEELPRIYDRFFRSDAARGAQGTGLGLPIVKTVIEGHGGTVCVESLKGRGTTVTMTLPIEESPAVMSASS